MSKQSSTAASTGFVVGVAVLALLLVLGVLLPKLHDRDLTLPDSLPGQLSAVDLDSTWDNVSDDVKQEYQSNGASLDDVQKGLESARAQVDATVDTVTDVKSASRYYVDATLQDIFAVEVFATGDNVHVPGLWALANQYSSVTVVDGASCVATSSSDGSAVTECELSAGQHTVVVDGPGDAKMIVRVAKDVLDKVA